MSRGRWRLVTAVAFLVCVAVAMGVMVHQARAESGTGAAMSAVLGNSLTWSVMTAPVTKDGNIVGYNVYVFQEKTGMLWAWEYGAERGLIRIPTRDQYEGGPDLLHPDRSKPRGETQ